MQWLLSGIGQEEQFMPLVSFYCLLFCWGVLCQIKSHQDFIVFTPAYIPTVQLIKCCIYRHFKSTAQAFPTLFLMQTSYYLVSEMQKSMYFSLLDFILTRSVNIISELGWCMSSEVLFHPSLQAALSMLMFYGWNVIQFCKGKNEPSHFELCSFIRPKLLGQYFLTFREWQENAFCIQFS